MNTGRLRDHMEKLNVYLEVCRARSFHAAARNLGLSQPSLSLAVKNLEDILDTRLLVRSRKGVDLTPAGEKLFHFSERLVSEVEGIEGRIRYPDQPMIGTVNIGTFATVTSYLLPKFLLEMARKYPKLSLGVTTLRADELAPALATRRCHFVIGTVEFEQKSITQYELYQDHFGFFASPALTRAGRQEAPLIYVAQARDSEGRTIEEILAEARLNRGHLYDVDNFESVRALVVEGLGIGILPLRLAEPYLKSGKLSALQMPELGKRFGTHRFFCAVLEQDLDDVRVGTVVRELRTWCREN